MTKNVIRFILGCIGIMLSAGILLAHTSIEKPWTYWWWMGSSVNESDITAQLQEMSQAGLGGVHIIPIYGEKGDEANFIPYLSPQWLEMLQHTIREANRLGMGVDMTMGTGWPFGGPDIPVGLAAQKLKISGDKFESVPTGQKVKRSAPGGEGFVMDHFNRAAIEYYAKRFREALSQCELKPRALYNDSYEVYGANCTTNFLAQFQQLRGYDLTRYLDCLDVDSTNVLRSRVISDYCETISDLLYSEFTRPWVGLCHQMGVGLVRNEVHGSPGNLLDLYALADIPETESFGVSDFKIPGLRHDPKSDPKRFGRPNPLVMKFASSAAHLTGKPLVSSESTTWLGDHFSVSLSQIKPQIDELFTAGINHIFFHGTTYSPPSKEFPGRLFYASTHYGHTSHFWNELPALTDYIAECQHRLQQSQPDNDILLYFPIYDIWSEGGGRGIIKMLDVHYLADGLKQMSFGKLAQSLWNHGYTFDYVSDRMLSECSFPTGKVILIPATQRMPVSTLERLKELAYSGMPVVFMDAIPEDVPGLKDYDVRQKSLKTCRESISEKAEIATEGTLDTVLTKLKVITEPFKAIGIDFIRKKRGDQTLYFLANFSDLPGDSWVAPQCGAGEFSLFDPETKILARAASRITDNGERQIRIQLPPGRSLFLLCNPASEKPTIPAWSYYTETSSGSVELGGKWNLTYRRGVPEISGETNITIGTSWTELGTPYDLFSGKLIYARTFRLSPDQCPRHYELVLGDVRETALVTINGTTLPLLWHVPFSTVIPDGVLKKENTIEIEVTNLSYNRIIDLDRRKVPWKNFYEINFVNIQYKPFDASNDSPLSSGLLSVPRLIPVLAE